MKLRWIVLIVTLLLAAAGEHSAQAEASIWAGPYPTLRIRMAPAVHLTTSPPVERRVDFALDLAVGVPIFISPSGSGDLLDRVVVIYPELGYAFQNLSQHLFTGGAYVGFGPGMVFGSYGARFLAGQEQNTRAIGLRHGLGLHLFVDVLSLELQHQVLWLGGQSRHDLVVWLGVNLVEIANQSGRIP